MTDSTGNAIRRIARESYEQEKPCCIVCDDKKVCTVCGDLTRIACSDCRIDFQTTVYVCQKTACQHEHEEKCSARLRERLAATEKRVREECAKAVCHHCRDSSHSEKYITKAKQVEGKWIHEEIGFEHERGGFDCYAAAIRSLELKGE